MIFDLFHSVSDPVVNGRRLGAAKSVAQFLSQAELGESLGIDTVWVAESHFSSETQKGTSVATIPQFHGEVGLNGDSFQLFHVLASRTKRIGLGTGIHNIVGGSGGPIASADRVNQLHFLSRHFWPGERMLRLGIAAGRFPYQNTPFGLVPRNAAEQADWNNLKRYAFLEALEIFLRLLRGEELAASDVTAYPNVSRRWDFERLQLAPRPEPDERLRIVLGSADPLALELARRFWDVDLFNLSFTPPEQIEALHRKLSTNHPWHRSRLPRTVLVFIDPDRRKARELANFVLDAYIEAMRGTAQVPDKAVLLERALVGDAAEVRDQLHPENPRRLHADDRLMLWFEFNQLDGEAVETRMKYFFQEVVGRQ